MDSNLLEIEVYNEIEVAAFNVQVFGRTKMQDERVVELLVEVILRYDVILIQEIRDSSETAIYDLLDEVNEQSARDYEIVVSPRLGNDS